MPFQHKFIIHHPIIVFGYIPMSLNKGIKAGILSLTTKHILNPILLVV